MFDTWKPVEGTSAAYHATLEHHDGVGVLVVRLRGSVSRYGEEVFSLRDTLDDIGVAAEGAEVSVLDVSTFANADGDEAGALRSVFVGLPCMWVTPRWDQQDADGQKWWDIPAAPLLAPTVHAAIQQVVAWRSAGRLSVGREAAVWTARGLERQQKDMLSIYHRNRLVERRIDRRQRRILWPFLDRTGQPNEATRLGARLVYQADALTEIDFSPGQTGRPENPKWLSTLADLPHLEELRLYLFPATDADIAAALACFPDLKRLDIRGTGAGEETAQALLSGACPNLERLLLKRGALRDRLEQGRPTLRISA